MARLDPEANPLADSSRRLELKALKRERVERCVGPLVAQRRTQKQAVGGSRAAQAAVRSACRSPTAAQWARNQGPPCAALEAPTRPERGLCAPTPATAPPSPCLY